MTISNLDAPLTEKDREALSNLIRKLVENLPPRRGRPRGSRLLGPVRAAEYMAAQRVLEARSQWRRRERRKRLPRTRPHEGEKTKQAELIDSAVKDLVQQWCPELKSALLDENNKVRDDTVANVERILKHKHLLYEDMRRAGELGLLSLEEFYLF